MMELKIREYEGSGDLLAVIGEEDADYLKTVFPDLHILAVSGFDWNDMLSPWPAEKVFAKGDDFGGRADELLAALLPKTARYDRTRHIAGYSLAGLFAVYAACRTDLFAGCASVSGSLWFPGFAEWLEDHPVQCRRLYLSVGDKEKKTKNPLMSSVETKTEQIAAMFSGKMPVRFETNPGNHFFPPRERMARAVSWLTGSQE